MFFQVLGGLGFLWHGAFKTYPVKKEMLGEVSIMYIEYQFDPAYALTYYDHLVKLLKQVGLNWTAATHKIMLAFGDDFNQDLEGYKFDKKGDRMTKDRSRNILAVILRKEDLEDANRVAAQSDNMIKIAKISNVSRRPNISHSLTHSQAELHVARIPYKSMFTWKLSMLTVKSVKKHGVTGKRKCPDGVWGYILDKTKSPNELQVWMPTNQNFTVFSSLLSTKFGFNPEQKKSK